MVTEVIESILSLEIEVKKKELYPNRIHTTQHRHIKRHRHTRTFRLLLHLLRSTFTRQHSHTHTQHTLLRLAPERGEKEMMVKLREITLTK